MCKITQDLSLYTHGGGGGGTLNIMKKIISTDLEEAISGVEGERRCN